mmetsp:Transcript_17677/g.44164  ORF Transcript_17677/g.44164 Transcript_17677/m.44164 type:complete len:201 (-) Transcript_17677:195-797(-)
MVMSPRTSSASSSRCDNEVEFATLPPLGKLPMGLGPEKWTSSSPPKSCDKPVVRFSSGEKWSSDMLTSSTCDVPPGGPSRSTSFSPSPPRNKGGKEPLPVPGRCSCENVRTFSCSRDPTKSSTNSASSASSSRFKEARLLVLLGCSLLSVSKMVDMEATLARFSNRKSRNPSSCCSARVSIRTGSRRSMPGVRHPMSPHS